jgi:hypothetical protein
VGSSEQIPASLAQLQRGNIAPVERAQAAIGPGMAVYTRYAKSLVAKLGAKSGGARELAYRLYTICERKKRAAEALSYNALVQSWPEIARLAGETKQVTPVHGGASLMHRAMRWDP